MRLLLGASVLMVVVLTVLTLVILIRYRRGSRASRRPVGIATWKVEATWIAGTLAVFLLFFFEGAGVYAGMERIPPGLPEISVTGRQWMWDVRYPDGRREFNVLHLRRDTPVRIVLSSEDVIHSFFVPAFRIKQDLVPGRIVSTWFNPTRVGSYTLFCAQYCGTAHAQMLGQVIVLDASDYAAWAQGGSRARAAGAPAARGQAVYRRLGCAVCHEGRNAAPAPPLRGLYGGVAVMADGRRLQADEQYLRDAVLDGPHFRVADYPPVMPTFAGILAPGDTVDLVAYLQSLGGSPPAAPAPP
jgi:cytochrome c oxidase subunit 2